MTENVQLASLHSIARVSSRSYVDQCIPLRFLGSPRPSGLPRRRRTLSDCVAERSGPFLWLKVSRSNDLPRRPGASASVEVSCLLPRPRKHEPALLPSVVWPTVHWLDQLGGAGLESAPADHDAGSIRFEFEIERRAVDPGGCSAHRLIAVDRLEIEGAEAGEVLDETSRQADSLRLTGFFGKGRGIFIQKVVTSGDVSCFQ